MAWSVEFDKRAAKDVRNLPSAVAARILREMVSVIESGDPSVLGKALKGREKGRRWSYRVGSYRIICSIDDAREVVLVAQVGDRKEVYR